MDSPLIPPINIGQELIGKNRFAGLDQTDNRKGPQQTQAPTAQPEAVAKMPHPAPAQPQIQHSQAELTQVLQQLKLPVTAQNLQLAPLLLDYRFPLDAKTFKLVQQATRSLPDKSDLAMEAVIVLLSQNRAVTAGNVQAVKQMLKSGPLSQQITELKENIKLVLPEQHQPRTTGQEVKVNTPLQAPAKTLQTAPQPPAPVTVEASLALPKGDVKGAVIQAPLAQDTSAKPIQTTPQTISQAVPEAAKAVKTPTAPTSLPDPAQVSTSLKATTPAVIPNNPASIVSQQAVVSQQHARTLTLGDTNKTEASTPRDESEGTSEDALFPPLKSVTATAPNRRQHTPQAVKNLSPSLPQLHLPLATPAKLAPISLHSTSLESVHSLPSRVERQSPEAVRRGEPQGAQENTPDRPLARSIMERLNAIRKGDTASPVTQNPETAPKQSTKQSEVQSSPLTQASNPDAPEHLGSRQRGNDGQRLDVRGNLAAPTPSQGNKAAKTDLSFTAKGEQSVPQSPVGQPTISKQLWLSGHGLSSAQLMPFAPTRAPLQQVPTSLSPSQTAEAQVMTPPAEKTFAASATKMNQQLLQEPPPVRAALSAPTTTAVPAPQPQAHGVTQSTPQPSAVIPGLTRNPEKGSPLTNQGEEPQLTVGAQESDTPTQERPLDSRLRGNDGHLPNTTKGSLTTPANSQGNQVGTPQPTLPNSGQTQPASPTALTQSPETTEPLVAPNPQASESSTKSAAAPQQSTQLQSSGAQTQANSTSPTQQASLTQASGQPQSPTSGQSIGATTQTPLPNSQPQSPVSSLQQSGSTQPSIQQASLPNASPQPSAIITGLTRNPETGSPLTKQGEETQITVSTQESDTPTQERPLDSRLRGNDGQLSTIKTNAQQSNMMPTGQVALQLDPSLPTLTGKRAIAPDQLGSLKTTVTESDRQVPLRIAAPEGSFRVLPLASPHPVTLPPVIAGELKAVSQFASFLEKVMTVNDPNKLPLQVTVLSSLLPAFENRMGDLLARMKLLPELKDVKIDSPQSRKEPQSDLLRLLDILDSPAEKNASKLGNIAESLETVGLYLFGREVMSQPNATSIPLYLHLGSQTLAAEMFIQYDKEKKEDEKNGKDLGRIVLSIQTKRMGPVDIDMMLHGENLQVGLSVTNQAVQTVVNQYLDELRESLALTGYNLQGVTCGISQVSRQTSLLLPRVERRSLNRIEGLA